MLAALSHPGPQRSDGTYVGRSAPEIDIFEATVSAKGVGGISQRLVPPLLSCQCRKAMFSSSIRNSCSAPSGDPLMPTTWSVTSPRNAPSSAHHVILSPSDLHSDSQIDNKTAGAVSFPTNKYHTTPNAYVGGVFQQVSLSNIFLRAWKLTNCALQTLPSLLRVCRITTVSPECRLHFFHKLEYIPSDVTAPIPRNIIQQYPVQYLRIRVHGLRLQQPDIRCGEDHMGARRTGDVELVGYSHEGRSGFTNRSEVSDGRAHVHHHESGYI